MRCSLVCLVALCACSSTTAEDDDEGLPGQGAWLVAFQSPGSCGLDIHNAQVGSADESQLRQLLRDGDGNAEISCAVRDQGGPFVVEASIGLGASLLEVAIPSITNGTPETAPATGTVTFQSAETTTTLTSPGASPCAFWHTGVQEVASGRAWMQFSCPSVVTDDGARDCALGESTVVVQNCDQ